MVQEVALGYYGA